MNIEDQAVGKALGDFLLWLWEDVLSVAGGLAVVSVGAVVLLLWRVSLLVWPHKRCWHCKGTGAKKGPFAFRKLCTVCGGQGLRPRAGTK